MIAAELVDTMGDDLTAVNAARVSFAKESAREEDGSLSERDRKLVRYLARHNHWTPFGHAQATFRVTAPIFVARQLATHQVGLVWNEVSRRYVDDPPEFFRPEGWRGRPTDGSKQGSSGLVCEHAYREAESVYDGALAECATAYARLLELGVAPEQARMVLPQAMMTEWYWTGSLMAWARVCRLRLDSHAQAESRQVAEDVHEAMQGAFPVAWEALMV